MGMHVFSIVVSLILILFLFATTITGWWFVDLVQMVKFGVIILIAWTMFAIYGVVSLVLDIAENAKEIKLT